MLIVVLEAVLCSARLRWDHPWGSFRLASFTGFSFYHNLENPYNSRCLGNKSSRNDCGARGRPLLGTAPLGPPLGIVSASILYWVLRLSQPREALQLTLFGVIKSSRNDCGARGRPLLGTAPLGSPLGIVSASTLYWVLRLSQPREALQLTLFGERQAGVQQQKTKHTQTKEITTPWSAACGRRPVDQATSGNIDVGIFLDGLPGPRCSATASGASF